ncbi:uncharacterized protein LOC135501423 [Lineus longissimus]|uniref:uncharacterized protein LOC135501423 n=1 Tax=Lineus longissimus TaxID=88925 RepID=UPI00315CA1B2
MVRRSSRVLKRKAEEDLEPDLKLVDVEPESRWKKLCRIKEEKGLLESFRKDESTRLILHRISLSDEQRKQYNAKAAERMRRYRERKKENINPQKRMTRAEIQSSEEKKTKQREYWRLKKQEYRASLTGQAKRRRREKERAQREPEQGEVVSSHVSPDEESDEDFQTDCARRKAISRVKQCMPKTPKKWIKVIGGLVRKMSPRKQKHAENHGFVNNPDNTVHAEIGINISKEVDKLKKKRDRKSLAVRRRLVLAMPRRANSVKWSKLVNRQSDMRDEQMKTSRSLSDSLKGTIQEFYEENATVLPCQKRITKKLKKARSGLSFTTHRLHQKFVKQTGKKVGITSFRKLRPKHTLCRDKVKYNQCLCERCQNCDLKLKTINRFIDPQLKIKDRYHMAKLTVCEYEGDYPAMACILRKCSLCGVKKLRQYLEPTKPSTETCRWQVWQQKSFEMGGKQTKRKALAMNVGSVEELIDELCEEMENFSRHLFFASWQHQQFLKISKNPPEGFCVLVADYSENYRCDMQDEVQSAHWSYQQASIFPVVAYYRCPEPDCKEVVQESLVFVSNDLNHDASAVHNFLTKANQHLSAKTMIHHEVQFSDGCSAQFKSREPFADLSYGKHDYGFSVERSFFGSNHGKGPSDGLGAVVKRATRDAVKSRETTVQDAKDMCNYLEQNLTIPSQDMQDGCCHKPRTFFYVDAENIQRKRPSRHPNTGVKGTRSLHCVRGISPGHLMTRMLSCYCDSCMEGKYQQCVNKQYVPEWQVCSLRLPNITEAAVHFFADIQTQMKKVKDYGKLVNICTVAKEKLGEFPLGMLELGTISNLLKRDQKAERDIPNDMAHRKKALNVLADGNCFPRCASLLAYGNEDHHVEMRVRIVIEMTMNEDTYLNDNYLGGGFNSKTPKCGLASLFASFSDIYTGQVITKTVMTKIYRDEALKVAKPGSYCGIWQLFALASILQRPIFSVYPCHCNNEGVVRRNLHRLIIPRTQAAAECAHILWTNNRDDVSYSNWNPNHFVVLVDDHTSTYSSMTTMPMDPEPQTSHNPSMVAAGQPHSSVEPSSMDEMPMDPEPQTSHNPSMVAARQPHSSVEPSLSRIHVDESGDQSNGSTSTPSPDISPENSSLPEMKERNRAHAVKPGNYILVNVPRKKGGYLPFVAEVVQKVEGSENVVVHFMERDSAPKTWRWPDETLLRDHVITRQEVLLILKEPLIKMKGSRMMYVFNEP